MEKNNRTRRKPHSNKGMMSGAVIATAGIFFTLHTILPEQKLWRAFLIIAGIVTMLVSHYKKSRIQNLDNK